MTEIRQQNLQSSVDRAIARRRLRDDEIKCPAIEKDPDGGLQCTARGLALDSPQAWYGHQSVGQTLTGSYVALTVDTEDLNTSADHFSFGSNELTVLKKGLLLLEVKVVVETEDLGRFAFEVIIEEDPAGGYADLATTEAASGRGELT